MNHLKKTVLVFCFMTSQVALPMQVKFHILKSIKKTAFILGATAYTHSVVTGPQNFTHLPEMSLQSMEAYGKKWSQTIDNTAQSLKLDEKRTSLSTLFDTMKKEASLRTSSTNLPTPDIEDEKAQTKTPTQKESLGSFSPRDTEDTSFLQFPKNKLSSQAPSDNAESDDSETPNL